MKINSIFKTKPFLNIIIALFIASASLRIVGTIGPAIAQVEGPQEIEPTSSISGSIPIDMTDERQRLERLMNVLSERKEKLDLLEKSLEQKEQALTILKDELDKNMSDLAGSSNPSQMNQSNGTDTLESRIDVLTSVYENMKAKDAAPVFETMNPEFASGLIGRMHPEVAAKILAGLSTEKAYAITAMLAGRGAKAQP